MCPTPIGNLKDITLRVILVLRKVDLIASEDTRVTRILLDRYSIHTPLISFHSYSSEKKVERFIEEMSKGKEIALVTDAGTPGISDPGYRLIKACIDNNIHVEVMPGPTSFIPALLLSGFPPAHFIFYGFLPRKKGKRKKILQSFTNTPWPVIFFESPFRVKQFLDELMESVGDVDVAVVRELTKIYEEVLRGKVSDVLSRLKDRTIKGEIIIVVSYKK